MVARRPHDCPTHPSVGHALAPPGPWTWPFPSGCRAPRGLGRPNQETLAACRGACPGARCLMPGPGGPASDPAERPDREAVLGECPSPVDTPSPSLALRRSGRWHARCLALARPDHGHGRVPELKESDPRGWLLAWRPGGSAAAAGGGWRVHDGASLPEVPAWPSKLVQAVLGQRRVDLDLVVVVGSVGRPGRPGGRPR
jgi:hypothetical protein